MRVDVSISVAHDNENCHVVSTMWKSRTGITKGRAFSQSKMLIPFETVLEVLVVPVVSGHRRIP